MKRTAITPSQWKRLQSGLFDREFCVKDFEYFRPKTVNEALYLFETGGSSAKLLAGGTELVNEMRMGKTQPDQIIDLKLIKSMDYMDLGAEGLKIGALYRVRDAECSVALKQSPYNALSYAASTLGSPQVRNKATIVGNLCRCSPSADLIPPLIALGATVRIMASHATERTTPVEYMLLGPGKTSLQEGEIVTDLEIPQMPAHAGCAYYKLSPRKSLDLAVVGVAAMVRLNPQHSECLDARIALGAVAPTAIRARRAESRLVGKKLSPELIEEAAQEAAKEAKPIDDVRATAWYRKKMVAVATIRAIALALDQIQTRR
jgi:CO/xanthine dehydrogenase FAD-binding subunit